VLPDIGNRAAVHVGGFQRLQKLRLALLAQLVFQLGRVVEVILQRRLAPAGYEDELLDPAARASSIAYWINGRSTSVMISLGTDFVAGRNRVPRPATGKIAFRDPFFIIASYWCALSTQTRRRRFHALMPLLPNR
jgi:hypothetical protein